MGALNATLEKREQKKKRKPNIKSGEDQTA